MIFAILRKLVFLICLWLLLLCCKQKNHNEIKSIKLEIKDKMIFSSKISLKNCDIKITKDEYLVFYEPYVNNKINGYCYIFAVDTGRMMYKCLFENSKPIDGEYITNYSFGFYNIDSDAFFPKDIFLEETFRDGKKILSKELYATDIYYISRKHKQ